MFELSGKYNTCKIFTDNCDNETISQLTDLLNQESVKGSKIRIMPDTHAGKGCVIGTTMTLQNKVIRNLGGVDIGCGMLAIKLKEKEIVKAAEGSNGGYMLEKRPEEISLMDVINCTESTMAISRCLEKDGYCSRNYSD